MRKVLIGVSIDAVGVTRLPKLLSAAGCEITLVSGPGLAISSSRFVKHRVVTGRDPASVHEGMEAHLAQFAGVYSAVLIKDEPLLRTFLDVPASPALAALAPVAADPQRLARMLSKVRFNQDAAAAGVPVPRFRILEEGSDLPRNSWRGVPTVAKSEVSLSGSGVRVIHNAEELRDVNEHLTSRPMLFQEYKTGRVGATAVLYEHGVPKCWYSYFLCRNWPNALSAASALEIFWHPTFESIVAQIGKMTAFHGFCGLDWVFDEELDTPLILEMNPRPIPGMYVARRAGVDFSLGFAQWLEGHCQVQKPSPEATGYARLFPQNLFRSLDDHDIPEFLETFTDAPFSDPLLLLSQIRRVITHYLPRTWRDNAKRWLSNTRTRVKSTLRRPGSSSDAKLYR